MQTKLTRLAELREYVAHTNHDGIRLANWFRRPQWTLDQMPAELRATFPDDLWDTIQIEFKYAGYIARQDQAIEKLRRSEEKLIPPHFDYAAISGLRAETRQKLTAIRPATFGQAARISGVTPADLALLSVFLEK
jgi:tRNA uridine 5-carboxymethylaminomethyl modification enzyme